MKTILFILLVLFFGGCNNLGKKVELSDADRKMAENAFNELNEVLKSEKGQFWNHSLESPLMLVNRETRTLIANENDVENSFIQHGNLFVDKLPETMNIANTAISWNGKRWTMVALPLPETKAERLNLLIHESFHNIQPAIGFDSLYEIQNVHFDRLEGRIYLKLELEALKKALISGEPLQHIKNALLFRYYRYHLFPEAKEAENSLEINEGLAEYTGSLLSGRSDTDLKMYYINQIEWFYTLPTFVRSFAYFTLPVYGYFMQQSNKQWNLQLTKETNLSDFIADFFGVTFTGLNEETVLVAGKNYGMGLIVENETIREAKKEEQLQKYKEVFLGDSLLVIALQKMEIGFNPSNIVPLDSLGTVYPTLRISDAWGILEVDSCGALINPQWSKVCVSYPQHISDTLISGLGWKLKLTSSWKLEKADGGFGLVKR
jgi:hypothetical protein